MRLPDCWPSGSRQVLCFSFGSRLELIRVGEQTGSLPDMLNHVADFYDEDVNLRSTALLSWVEPVILLFVAAFIAMVLISLYMPIFSIGTSVQT